MNSIELMKQDGNLPEWQVRNLVHGFPNLRKSPLPLGLAGDEEDGDRPGRDPDRSQTLPGDARR